MTRISLVKCLFCRMDKRSLKTSRQVRHTKLQLSSSVISNRQRKSFNPMLTVRLHAAPFFPQGRHDRRTEFSNANMGMKSRYALSNRRTSTEYIYFLQIKVVINITVVLGLMKGNSSYFFIRKKKLLSINNRIFHLEF